MRLMIPLPFLLAGCMAVDSPDDSGAELARVLDGRVAAETRTCVPLMAGRSLRVIDSRTLVYRAGDTVWINRLPGDCPGLDFHSALIVETSSGQYCRGDRVGELEWGSAIPGPQCILGEFTAYRRVD